MNHKRITLPEHPKVSVIMAVYNCEKTLNEAIDSILRQTYTNWEFIICNDCSTDATQRILDAYKEKYPEKFILFQNKRNMKLGASLNECLKYVSGPLVARMDGDDISEPTRFEEQVKALRAHPEYQLVGTGCRRFDEKGLHDVVNYIAYPDRNTLRRHEPFLHATIMLYRDVYEELNGYRVTKKTARCEDYDMWFRFYEHHFEGFNIQKPLYLVREDINAIRRRTVKSRFYGLQITLHGFKTLKYPWYCSIRPVVFFLIKAATPPRIALKYREFQAKTNKN